MWEKNEISDDLVDMEEHTDDDNNDDNGENNMFTKKEVVINGTLCTHVPEQTIRGTLPN